MALADPIRRDASVSARAIGNLSCECGVLTPFGGIDVAKNVTLRMYRIQHRLLPVKQDRVEASGVACAMGTPRERDRHSQRKRLQTGAQLTVEGSVRREVARLEDGDERVQGGKPGSPLRRYHPLPRSRGAREVDGACRNREPLSVAGYVQRSRR
ncbi:MAG: hypothetical protein NVSMB29_15830 [Candidatus Dormibacteria bacterium]